MVFTIPREEVLVQLLLQLKSHFLFLYEEEKVIEARFEYALAACEECFLNSDNKYYLTEVGG